MSVLVQFFTVLLCIYSSNARISVSKIESYSKLRYIVGIKSKTLTENYYCTGGIIHEKYILTAAHCFAKKVKANPDGGYYYEYKKRKVDVYANTNSLKKISADAIHRTATDVYFTKKFFDHGIDDIAILKLEKSLDLSKTKDLQALQLPQVNDNNAFDGYFNKHAVAAGYGDNPETDKINKKLKRSLKTLDVKIIGINECFKEFTPGIPVNTTKHMCANAVELIYATEDKSNKVVGMCTGDSGAPIVYEGTTIIGIVSAGFGCDSRLIPELYMRVTSYLNFIKTIINENEFNEKHYVHYKTKSSPYLP